MKSWTPRIFIKVTVALTVFALLLMTALPSLADRSDKDLIGRSATDKLPAFEGIGIDQKIGKSVDLNLVFKNEEGQPITLGQILESKRPLILSPVYYGCKSLCNFHLNGVTEGLKDLDWSAGQRFDVVAISFDPSEGPELAKAKKQAYMDLYGRPGTQNGWHFLTGDAVTLAKFTASVGFKYKWDPEQKEWAHPSSAILVRTDGVISRYLPGVYFKAQDFRLALNEAAHGELGTFIDRLVLFCYRYDEHKSQYTPYAMNIMKIGGGLMVIFLLAWILPVLLRKDDGSKNRKELKRA